MPNRGVLTLIRETSIFTNGCERRAGNGEIDLGDFFTGALTIVSTKLLIILSSMSMAVIAVGLDAKRHSFPSALMAIFAGTVVGVIAASSICSLMGWSEQVGYGISAVAAVSGNNLVKWLLRASVDPISLWRRFRGDK